MHGNSQERDGARGKSQDGDSLDNMVGDRSSVSAIWARMGTLTFFLGVKTRGF